MRPKIALNPIKPRRIPRSLVFLAALGGLMGCGVLIEDAGPKLAPDFTLKTVDGKSLTLSDIRGKVVLIDFWATWCEPCHDSIPVFERFHKEYREEGFVVLGVNVDGDSEYVPNFVRRFRMTYPVLLDEGLAVMRSYRVRGLPNMFLLDKNGRVRKHWIGIDDALEGVMETQIQILLDEDA